MRDVLTICPKANKNDKKTPFSTYLSHFWVVLANFGWENPSGLRVRVPRVRVWVRLKNPRVTRDNHYLQCLWEMTYENLQCLWEVTYENLIEPIYCTISFNSSPLVMCDQPDEISVRQISRWHVTCRNISSSWSCTEHWSAKSLTILLI